jgi:MFS family permease
VVIPLVRIVAAVGVVVFVAVMPLAGRVLDLYGGRIVLMAGAVCTAAGLALLGGTLASLPLALRAQLLSQITYFTNSLNHTFLATISPVRVR